MWRRALSLGSPTYREALTQADRWVPAHRQVTGSYLHTEAFSRAQFVPPQELLPLSARGRPRAAGGEELGLKEQASAVVLLLGLAGRPGTLLTTENGGSRGRTQRSEARLGEVPSQRKVPHPFWLLRLPCKILPRSSHPWRFTVFGNGRGVLYL